MQQILRQRIINRKLNLVLLFAWVAGMFYVMLSPSSALPKVSWLAFIPYYDKFIHAGIFFGFSFLLFCLLEYENSLKRIVVSTFFLSSGFGLFTEGVQFLLKNLTHRSFEYMDFFADVGGVIIALVLGRFLTIYREKQFIKRRQQKHLQDI